MAADTMWVKTHEALKKFAEVLTCEKCNNKLRNPKQFLNCGHYACASCIKNESNCVLCQIPGGASDTYADTDVNEILRNLNIIAEAVGLNFELDDKQYVKPRSPVPSISNSETIAKIRRRISRKGTKAKSINDTCNTSVCDSTISKTTFTIPKNIDRKNNKGETVLHIACRSDNEERVKILLDAGAKPNTKDNAGWTPLQEATSYGCYKICEMLLNSGANPNMYGYDNRTALHEAVIIDNCKLVSLLLGFNANKEACDNVGKKPKDYCKSKEVSALFKSSQKVESNTSVSSNTTMLTDKAQNVPLSNNIPLSKIILYGSNLKQKNQKLLIKLSNEKKIKVHNHLSPSVSHVVIESESGDNIILSLDVLQAILYGKRLLNSDCLPILVDAENITLSNLSLFELNPPQLDDGPTRARENLQSQNPKLFNNCHFYFAIKGLGSFKYDGVSFTKTDLMKLVAAGDGVVLTREPKVEDIQGSLTPFHVAHDPKHSLHKCTHYIIYVPDNDSLQSNSHRICYNMPTLKSLPLMWFVESILRYKLLDPVSIGLLPD